jgi:acetyl-CoA carboxylase biotin carboxyl carrier protein
MDLTDEDVAEVLALLDSLPYDELDLQTPRFRLTLRRTPGGWTQSSQSLAEPDVLEPADPPEPAGPLEPAGPPATASMAHRGGYNRTDGPSVRSGPDAREAIGTGRVIEAVEAEAGDARKVDGTAEANRAEEVFGESDELGERAAGLVAVRAPLPGTFYRAPRPGAAAFVEVGSWVSADTVVGIVETMKLMTSVAAGADGTVAEICLANAEPTAQGTTLMRIRADP